MDAALELLLSPAFRLGAAATNWGEVVGFATGVVCVWLLARQSLWNWPLAIVDVLLLGVLGLRAGRASLARQATVAAARAAVEGAA